MKEESILVYHFPCMVKQANEGLAESRAPIIAYLSAHWEILVTGG